MTGCRPPAVPSVSAADAAGARSPSQSSRCRKPHKAARTFIGFSEEMTLADFETAAFEAERILLVVAELCGLARVAQAHPSLRAALDAGAQLEITSIHFTRDDAGAADVHLGRAREAGAMPGEVGGPSPTRWVLQLERDAGTGWHIVASAPT